MRGERLKSPCDASRGLLKSPIEPVECQPLDCLVEMVGGKVERVFSSGHFEFWEGIEWRNNGHCVQRMSREWPETVW